ncbi:MAG: 16S rRNA (guanine(966)-N(2))-methyltransferase RsmD [Lentisphaerota bacterium]
MMRITGGILGGRRVEVFDAGVRPTQDKVRAAIYSSLGDFVVEARVLDLFAGTGAMGIEAWSRGASYVCWVESHRKVFATLRRNIEGLCRGEGGATECVLSDAGPFLRIPRGPEPFQLIRADPPYEKGHAHGWLARLLESLGQKGWLAERGLFIYEQGADEGIPESPGWTLVKEKKYGDTRVLYFARTPEGPRETP